MINVGVIGFGKTGKYVCEELLKSPLFTLKWVLKKERCDFEYASQKFGFKDKIGKFFFKHAIETDFFKTHKVDVVIDFSHEDSALSYYNSIAKANAKIISAISHYPARHMDFIKTISKEIAVLHSPNITIGINWIMIASKMLNRLIPEADVVIVEEHFKNKAGVSGTALKLADNLGVDVERNLCSIRAGAIVGKHEIIFGMASQTIRLIHESVDRSAFAGGALLAAQWIQNKGPGLFTFEDTLKDIIGNN